MSIKGRFLYYTNKMLMVLKYPNPMHTPSTEEMFRVRERLLMDAMSNSKSVSHARLIQNNLEGKFSSQ